MMTPERFANQIDYCVEMSIAKSLLSSGLITVKEYDNINNTVIKEHDPIIRLTGGEPTTSQAVRP